MYQRIKRLLTWATVEEACELRPLAGYKKLFRAILPCLLVAFMASLVSAQCPGGVCPRPVRSIVSNRGPSHLPRLQSPIRPISAPQSHGHCRGHRGHRLFGHGLFPRLRFAP